MIGPNIYFISGEFGIRWTLIAFTFINVLLLIKIFINRRTFSISKSNKCNGILLLTFIYISTICIYFFRVSIGNAGKSAIYKVADYLNSIESLVVVVLLLTLYYGFTFKNSHTFINLYFKILAAIEITYIISYYITNQVKLEGYNWLVMTLLGIVFVLLSKLKVEKEVENAPQLNIHDAVKEYDDLFPFRKYQADEIVEIIERKTCDFGYSVCVTGEWGAGKTSLVNGAYNKAKQNGLFNLHEIRINAMELYDIASFIKYFFKRIEDILKTNGIYTGIASEYKELIASISGTIISESITDFISEKLNSGNSDYRENIDNLGKLLLENLCGSRILIIIDDIERCSPEKVKSYLFFVKEIAIMANCITIFLANTDELEKTCDLSKSFLDKFFNYTINLSTGEFGKKFFNSKISSDLEDEILKILRKFDDKIEKARSEMFPSIQDRYEREKHRETHINSIKKEREQFSIALSNPRRVIKADEYYNKLTSRVKQQCDCSGDKKEDLESFIFKVDYKKQLALLSIIYGLYDSEFAAIQQNGIFNYIGDFAVRSRTDASSKEIINRVLSLIEDEWCFLGCHSSDFRIQEALRFVNCLLTAHKELVNISNGYNSIEDQYISRVNKGELPDDITFPDLIEMLYFATHNKLSERKDLIKRVFDLYAKNLKTDSVDTPFELFSHHVARNSFSGETPALQMFFSIFCSDNRCLVSPEKIKRNFVSFASAYLLRNVTTFSIFFLPISSDCESYEFWNSASEAILSKDTCEDMLNAYSEKCEVCLNHSNETIDTSAISRIKNLIVRVNAEYSELQMTECPDVFKSKKSADDLIVEITYLFEIERFINECVVSVEHSSFSLCRLSVNNLAQEIEKLHSELSERIDYNRKEDILGLLRFACRNECEVTLIDYENLNNLVKKFFLEYGGPIAPWRKMLIYIKRTKAKCKCQVENTQKSEIESA